MEYDVCDSSGWRRGKTITDRAVKCPGCVCCVETPGLFERVKQRDELIRRLTDMTRQRDNLALYNAEGVTAANAEEMRHVKELEAQIVTLEGVVKRERSNFWQTRAGNWRREVGKLGARMAALEATLRGYLGRHQQQGGHRRIVDGICQCQECTQARAALLKGGSGEEEKDSG